MTLQDKLRVGVLVAINAFLVPLYVIFVFISIALALLPFFPSRVGKENLQSRLGLGRWGSLLAMANVYFHYLVYLVEIVLFIPFRLVVRLRETEFTQFLAEVAARHGLPPNRGFVFLGAHYGNIEICGSSLAASCHKAFGTLVMPLAKPAPWKLATRVIDVYRRWCGMNILWTDRKDLVRAMLNAARAGHSLAYLIDQKPSHGGLFLNFFGSPAAFPFAGLDVGVKMEMPIVHVTARRVFPGCAVLLFEEGFLGHIGGEGPRQRVMNFEGTNAPKNEERGSKEERVKSILDRYVPWLENVVRERPLQWCWDYKKWSRQDPRRPTE